MVGPLRTGRSGFTHVLVAVDKFTKWIEAKPIKNLDAGTCVKPLRPVLKGPTISSPHTAKGQTSGMVFRADAGLCDIFE